MQTLFLRHRIFGYFSFLYCKSMRLKACGVLGKHVGGQLEVFKGVEGDVPVVHHGKDHRDVSALEGQQLDSPQVGDRAVETGTRRGGSFV